MRGLSKHNETLGGVFYIGESFTIPKSLGVSHNPDGKNLGDYLKVLDDSIPGIKAGVYLRYNGYNSSVGRDEFSKVDDNGKNIGRVVSFLGRHIDYALTRGSLLYLSPGETIPYEYESVPEHLEEILDNLGIKDNVILYPNGREWRITFDNIPKGVERDNAMNRVSSALDKRGIDTDIDNNTTLIITRVMR